MVLRHFLQGHIEAAAMDFILESHQGKGRNWEGVETIDLQASMPGKSATPARLRAAQTSGIDNARGRGVRECDSKGTPRQPLHISPQLAKVQAPTRLDSLGS